MFNPLDLFKSKDNSARAQDPTWDPKSVTMAQPTSPNAPTTERVVSEQPAPQEGMRMELRGGDEAGFCCGLCAGIACFECCECCC
ncbi:hypothetical protein P175DRAFT_0505034 [Aspergillus ochraceoroseus IBT 24754]|uniref:Cysteine-rich transmembrane CYSTM domain-containing protein n=3 Tax=Aspergillus subgen. Nidulantes TaxID=2720870 RepID=A0A0F8V879_9EURO|nr:uncharacterized protein P175DRAFT_0505034 [Aspergillus ochraceoroseus IBT 24754]KKK19166.1 hypothetical protein ARAM_001408 [Aspergillus rambellii]PTU17272.1 hypothetical protein P175DRAFT_0505034 [Aspergillus ochraceoroseus IBT 24754]